MSEFFTLVRQLLVLVRGYDKIGSMLQLIPKDRAIDLEGYAIIALKRISIYSKAEKIPQKNLILSFIEDISMFLIPLSYNLGSETSRKFVSEYRREIFELMLFNTFLLKEKLKIERGYTYIPNIEDLPLYIVRISFGLDSVLEDPKIINELGEHVPNETYYLLLNLDLINYPHESSLSVSKHFERVKFEYLTSKSNIFCPYFFSNPLANLELKINQEPSIANEVFIERKTNFV